MDFDNTASYPFNSSHLLSAAVKIDLFYGRKAISWTDLDIDIVDIKVSRLQHPPLI